MFIRGVEKLGAFFYHHLFRRRRIGRILDSEVIFIPSANLYAIPLDVRENERTSVDINNNNLTSNKSWSVKSVYPELDNYDIHLRSLAVDLKQIKLINDNQKNYDYQNIARLNSVIKNLIFEINPKLEELYQKRDELTRLKNLAASSEIYGAQTAVYERAIAQVQSVIEGAEKFRHECLKFVRETLIERELVRADIDPDLLDWKLSFDEKSQSLQEKYETWREEVKAYLSLKSGINPKNSSGSLR
ncbi:MAG: hypothetical protein N5P05_002551 [Chroococcopsis gigantea SAG 12.99]|nr:hypothetical protein [Chlorogloea purpurea SAG 13.99]MDV3000945.1 hypothetical protein [Chroococcopsis gigantea SAG 12.99]